MVTASASSVWTSVPATYQRGGWDVHLPPQGDSRTSLRVNEGAYAEFYAGLGTVVMLVAPEASHDEGRSEVDRRLQDKDAWLQAYVYDEPLARWIPVMERGSSEDIEVFRSRDEALDFAATIARDIGGARVSRMPDWRGEDIGDYLRWFLNQTPNRIDYVRLFRSNDSNGAFDGLLLEPLRDSEELFEEVFEDYGPFRFSNPAALKRALTRQGRRR